MIESLKSFIAKNKLIAQGQKVLLACSGGMDSMVLADLLLKLKIPIAIVHVNHGLRGEESDADEALVKMYCLQNSIAFHSTRIHQDQLENQTGNFHEIARDFRYSYFEDLCIEHNYDLIATAHHLDDNIETLMHRLFRGTGIKGLSGIPLVRGKIIRPLLFIPKAKISEYAQAQKITYREDSSNQLNKYDRNFLRNDVIPLLNARYGNIEKRLASSIDNFKNESDLLNSLIQEKKNHLLSKKEDQHFLKKGEIIPYLKSNLFLFKLLEDFQFSKTQCDDMANSIHETSKQFLSDKYILTIERDELIVERRERFSFREIEIHSFPFSLKVDSKTTLQFSIKENTAIDLNLYQAVFDFDKLSGSLTIRTWQNGDSFKPLGMGGKSQKIKDFLVHVKHPSHSKKDCLVMKNDDDIAWVIPYRISEDYRVMENTNRVLLVEKMS